MIRVKGNYFLAILCLLVFSSCDKDDPVIPPGEELITTLIYTLTPASGGDALTMRFEDLDGDGGTDPTITGATLQADEVYSGTLQFLNESISPSENITEEILEEDLEHQVFFESTISDITVSYEDLDPENNPLGISSTLSTGDTGSGTLKIVLRHEPDKNATGVADGDITNAGGETDIEVSFPVDVE